jgi:hypothetical protein
VIESRSESDNVLRSESVREWPKGVTEPDVADERMFCVGDDELDVDAFGEAKDRERVACQK